MAKEKKISPLNALNGIGLEKPVVPFEIKGGSRLNKELAAFAVNQLAANFPEGKEALETAQKAGYSICLRNDMKKNGYVNPADKTINVNSNQGINSLEMAIMEHGANAAAIADGKLLTKYSESLITPPCDHWAMSLRPYGALVAEGKAYAAVAMDCMKNDANASHSLYTSDPYLFGLMQEFKDYHNADRKELLEAAIGYHFNQKEIKEQTYYTDAYKKNKTAVKMIQANADFKVNPEKARREIEAEKAAQKPVSNAAVKMRIQANKKETQEEMKLANSAKKDPNLAVLAAAANKKTR